MKAFASVKLRRSPRQNSPGQQVLENDGKDIPQYNSTERPTLLRKLMKALASVKLRRSSTQNSPGQQDLEFNGHDTLEPSFIDENKPFWGIPRLIYGTANQSSSEFPGLDLGRIFDDQIPRNTSDDDCPVPRG
jgi:hypothetical protein